MRSRFTGNFTPARASPSAVARKPRAKALGPVESIRVQSRSTCTGFAASEVFHAQVSTKLLYAQCAAGPIESERCRALQHVEATKFLVAKELSSATISKAHSDVLSSTHTCTGQRIDITKPGGPRNPRSFFTESTVDRNTRTPRYGQNVWRRGRRRNTEGKVVCWTSMHEYLYGPSCTMYARAHSVQCRKLEVETSAHSSRNSGFGCHKIFF